MKKQIKVLLSLFLVTFLFSCGSVASEQEANLAQSENGQVAEISSTKLASDKKYSFDEIDRKYKALKLKYSGKH